MTDYFDTNFYMYIHQGDGRVKPFVLTDASGKKPVDPNQKLRPSNAWMGKTFAFKNTMTGKETIVAADNEYGYAIRFIKKETAQAFSDKYKLGGIIQRKRFYYVLINKPMTEEVEVNEADLEHRLLTARAKIKTAYQMGSGAKSRVMSPHESPVGYYSLFCVYDSGEMELILSKSDTVIGMEHNRMRMSGAKKIARSGKLPKKFQGKPVTLDLLYKMLSAKVSDPSKIFGLQPKIMESVAAESVDFHEGREWNIKYGTSMKDVVGEMGRSGWKPVDKMPSGNFSGSISFKKGQSKAHLVVKGGNPEKWVYESVESTDPLEEAKVVGTHIKKVGNPTKIAGMVVQDYEYNGKKYMALHSFSGRETVIKMITPQGTVEVWRKSGNIQPDEAMRQYVTSSDFKEEVEGGDIEISEQFKAGDKVKVPHKGKMVSGKIVRFDDGGTSKAQQHGGGYVVDVGEPASILVPKQRVQKEETVTEYRSRWDHSRAFRRAYTRSSSYSGDPRWITAKYAGTDSHGKPFKKGERVLYYPNGKTFLTGAEAEKAWLEFLSAKGDEEGIPFAR
jgi:hypothetical protein